MFIKKFANWFDLDHRVKPDGDRKGKDASLKPDGDRVCAGRSMVEMLGVLAIIGVLSVGAIAGYSKAMMKYKLNKQMEQIGSILDYVNIHLDNLKRSRASITGHLIPLFKKLNVIPQEMIRENRDNVIYDVFATTILLVNYTEYGNYYFEFQLYLNKGKKESCMNLFTIAKAKREQLWRTKFQTTKGEEDGQAHFVWGDNYCTSEVKCLKDLTLTEMEDYCNVCEDKDTCIFFYQMML